MDICLDALIKEQDSCPLLQPEILKKTIELKGPQVDLHTNNSQVLNCFLCQTLKNINNYLLIWEEKILIQILLS